MRIAPLSSIIIKPNRQRRSFSPEKLMKLATGIQSKGLMHAPVLREVDGQLELVAGERRLRAIDFLWNSGNSFRYNGEEFRADNEIVPYVLLSDLDALAAEEAELEENVLREDLSWQELAAATKRLHDLRVAQAKARGESHDHVDTAEELNEGRGMTLKAAISNTRRDLIVAQHLEKPEVAKAKTADEAFKILKKAEAADRNAKLAEVIGQTFSSASHTLIQGDAWEELTRLPDSSFDVILSDPPYGMGADEFGDAGGSLSAKDHAYADDYETWLQLMRGVLPHTYRVAKAQAHLYLFCDLERFLELRGLAAEAGWRTHRTPLVWDKVRSQRIPWPHHGPRRQYELILYAIKGERRVNFIGPDVLSFPPDENLGHAAQKPVGLFHELLRRSVLPGNAVLDFCCGTGPIFPAAHELKCAATGIEGVAATAGIAAKRLETLK